MKKPILNILNRPAQWHMVGDGFRVYNYFPSGYQIAEHMNPFLMLDFNPQHSFAPSQTPRGVGVHPHKGFETVTIAYQGAVAHHDSAGNSGIIGPGEVQWMTAGSGVLHKEYHELEFSKLGGPFEMIQLWVNLPRQYKSEPPSYQTISLNNRCVWNSKNGASQVHVIAGQFKHVKSNTHTYSEMDVWDMQIYNESLEFVVPDNRHSSCLLINGTAVINEKNANAHDMVLFAHDGNTVKISTESSTRILWLSAQPIFEPVVQYGPFVMNTKQEIVEAMEQFHAGAFGRLED